MRQEIYWLWKVKDCDLEICSHEFYPVDVFGEATADNCSVCYIAKNRGS